MRGSVQAEQFSYCQPWMLAWGYRKQNLVAELVSYNADIMCLQVCCIHPALPSTKKGCTLHPTKTLLLCWTAEAATQPCRCTASSEEGLSEHARRSGGGH